MTCFVTECTDMGGFARPSDMDNAKVQKRRQPHKENKVEEEFLVLLADGWLDRDCTRNPIVVQSLSKLCLMSVQLATTYKVCPLIVNRLSN